MLSSDWTPLHLRIWSRNPFDPPTLPFDTYWAAIRPRLTAAHVVTLPLSTPLQLIHSRLLVWESPLILPPGRSACGPAPLGRIESKRGRIWDLLVDISNVGGSDGSHDTGWSAQPRIGNIRIGLVTICHNLRNVVLCHYFLDTSVAFWIAGRQFEGTYLPLRPLLRKKYVTIDLPGASATWKRVKTSDLAIFFIF